jgi:uncharacterized protein YbaR (Trm112 family)
MEDADAATAEVRREQQQGDGEVLGEGEGEGKEKETDEKEKEEEELRLLRALHELLLETQVLEGRLVCGRCGHAYPVKEGVANFLLPSHLGELTFLFPFFSFFLFFKKKD